MVSEPIYPITFLRTNDLEKTTEFYATILKFPVALDQSGCTLFKVGVYGYWGFCQTDKEIANPEQICLTVVVKTREEVDEWHKYLLKQDVTVHRPPQATPQYKIYNGFYVDPTGYTIEIQAFEDDGKPIGHDGFKERKCMCDQK